MTRILEAQARITAKDATGGVFAAIAGKLKGLEGQSRATNARLSSVISSVSGIIAPTLAAAGAVRSVDTFAKFDRRLTRLGLTAGATAEASKAAGAEIERVAKDTGLSVDQVLTGAEALAATGRTMEQTLAFLPSVARAAQAAGAEVDDIAKSADALSTHFGIAGKSMEGAFDVLVRGGELGQFELKDMARYLPSLAAQASAFGLKSKDGLIDLIALLQTVRKASGTSEEAFTGTRDLLAKITSDETSNRFKKFGVDVRKSLADARKEGRNLIDTIADLIAQATKGDTSKLNQLFADNEIRRAATAILMMRGELDRFRVGLRDAGGAVGTNLARVTGDVASNMQRAANAADILSRRIGEKLAGVAFPVLETINTTLDRIAAHDPNYRSKEPTQIERKGNRWVNAIVNGVNTDEDPAKVRERVAFEAEKKRLDDEAFKAIANEAEAIGRADRAKLTGAPRAGFLDPRQARTANAVAAAAQWTAMMAERARLQALDAEIRRQRASASGLRINDPGPLGGTSYGLTSFGFGPFGTVGVPGSTPTGPGKRGAATAPPAPSVPTLGNLDDVLGSRPVTAKLEGSIAVTNEIVIRPSPEFLAEVKRQVQASGPVSVTGPGSTGQTMTEAAPRRGRGDL